MSVSSVSSNIDLSQTYQTSGSSSRRLERQKDFNQLADALKSGDLSSAQQAFSAWQQLFATSSSNSQTQTQTVQQGTVQNPVTADISALGQALQSGDLTTAQTDFTQLQKDIQALGKGHHHHKASASSQDAATAGTSSSSVDLDQLLTAIGVQKSSGTDTSGSVTGLQQWLNTLTSIQGSSGTKLDLQGLQALVGSKLNISA
jgi:hypothetical protein